ncbi:MAG: hypothetical protein ABIE36_01860 [Candidatus Diapherotrites archaeon]
MILEEITIGEDEESKRKVIQNNLGKQAILKDDHKGWHFCKILKKGYDDEVYQVQRRDDGGKEQLYYHNLKQLIIIKNYSKLSKI